MSSKRWNVAGLPKYGKAAAIRFFEMPVASVSQFLFMQGKFSILNCSNVSSVMPGGPSSNLKHF